MLKGKWWEIYNDPQLNQLEERIATYNQGLRQALETYLAAQDQVEARAFCAVSHAFCRPVRSRTTRTRPTGRWYHAQHRQQLQRPDP
jgi:hypothetical protein